jgi:hypothetical protein
MSTVALCHDPAQHLLSLTEMRAALATGQLPDDLSQRVALALQGRELSQSPNARCAHSSPHPLTDLLNWPEMEIYLAEGRLPQTFLTRVESVFSDDVCINCDGVQCMGCVCRKWDHACVADCPSCC